MKYVAIVLLALIVLSLAGAMRHVLRQPPGSRLAARALTARIALSLLLFGLPRWGSDVIALAQTLWWLDVAMAMACGVLIPFMMFTRQEHSIDQMTAVWLLPVVAAEVAAASDGSTIASTISKDAGFIRFSKSVLSTPSSSGSNR